jgi:hypothetical protein
VTEELVPQQKDIKTASPAYLPFKTFMGAFDIFDHGVPTKIDRSMWRSQSGVLQGQIVMALRFFGLVDDKDQPRPALERFVTHKEQRKDHLKALLHHSYKSILDHDLTRMTPKMLNEEMEIFGLTGDTKRKAVAFFLRAAQFAELPMHPLLTLQSRSSPVTPRKKRKLGTTGNADLQYTANGGNDAPTSSSSDTKTVVLASGAVVTLKISANWLEMPADERRYVFDLIDMLQSPSAPVVNQRAEKADK